MDEFICKSCEHYLVCKHADLTAISCSQYLALVRCKDCRKCSVYDDVITGREQYFCRLWHGATREVDADSFCSAGERKDNER